MSCWGPGARERTAEASRVQAGRVRTPGAGSDARGLVGAGWPDGGQGFLTRPERRSRDVIRPRYGKVRGDGHVRGVAAGGGAGRATVRAGFTVVERDDGHDAIGRRQNLGCTGVALKRRHGEDQRQHQSADEAQTPEHVVRRFQHGRRLPPLPGLVSGRVPMWWRRPGRAMAAHGVPGEHHGRSPKRPPPRSASAAACPAASGRRPCPGRQSADWPCRRRSARREAGSSTIGYPAE